MKKRMVQLLIVMTLSLGLFGCGNQTQNEPETTATSDQDEVDAEMETENVQEADSEPETETEDLSSITIVTTVTEEVEFDSTGYEQLGNVYYKLSSDWTLSQENNGTLVYSTSDGAELFAICVQNETDYTDEEMIGVYEQSIFAMYGDNDSSSVETIGNYNWNVYAYKEDNLVDPSIYAKIYLYSDGSTTVYVEDTFAAGTEDSGRMKYLLESIVIE